MERNKGAIIRLVDDYLKRQGLTEPRGGVRTGSLVPLDEFRAMLDPGTAREAPPG